MQNNSFIRNSLAVAAITIGSVLSLVLILVVVILGGTLCGGQQAMPPITGTAPPNSSLNQAVVVVSHGNNRFAAALLIGSHLESGWKSDAVGAGSFGLFQIQNPADVPPVVHSDITRAQAMDPAQATNYMAPEYVKALQKLDRTDPGLWVTNPELAAERTAYYAERPKYDYLVYRGSATVHSSWLQTVAVMQSLGLSTSFSTGASSPGQLAIDTPPAAIQAIPATDCTTGPTGQPSAVSGDAATLAQQLLALPTAKLDYVAIFGAKADLQATASGQSVVPGPIGSAGDTKPCAARTPVAISADLLQVILDITRQYSITLGSMVSTHACDTGRHPLGRAVDIDAVNGVAFSGDDSSFSAGHMQLYRQFMAYVASVLPRGTYVNGRPVDTGGLGQQQCVSPALPTPQGLNTFPDTCTHLHVDVGYAPQSISP